MKKTPSHNKDFIHIIELISQTQQRTLLGVNTELIKLYWTIGAHISEKVENGSWGKNIVEELSNSIRNNFPNLKGFTRRGLYRMKQFYETYYTNKKVSTLLTQISWSNHLTILSKCKTIEEKQFYIALSAKEKWSNRILQRQIESSVFERTILSKTNVSTALSQLNATSQNILQESFKDTYIFEFLDLPENYQEKDLQRQLLSNLKKFLMELGSGFTFVGEEYRVQVGLHDYYIDLLLYHRELRCLVAIELKTTEFKPEHLGKINFYLEALDRNIKLSSENPSIGILICKGKDEEVVEFALSRNASPTMIADYETKLISKKKLQKKVNELYAILDQQNKE